MIEQGTLFRECPHTQTTITPEKRGPHHAREVCTKCKKFIRWVPSPETVQQRAENERLLSALSKRDDLAEYDRHFIRDITRIKNLSPKQQKYLNLMGKRYP